VNETKAIIRKQVRAARDAVPAETRREWSDRICHQALAREAYIGARTIHIFLSFQSEVDTRTIIDDALACGKRVAVPVFVKDSAETPCAQISTLDDDAFIFGKWAMRTPKVLRPVALDEIDLVFAPLVAFAPRDVAPRDGRWWRIGYGAGFYDRFLKRIRAGVSKLGLAFALQRCETIPAEPFDVALDDVITERM